MSALNARLHRRSDVEMSGGVMSAGSVIQSLIN